MRGRAGGEGPVAPPVPPRTALAGGAAPLWAGAALGWLAGTALQLQQADLWSDTAYLLMLAGAPVVAGGLAVVGRGTGGSCKFERLGRRFAVALILVPLLAAFAAFAATGLRAASRLADELPPALEGIEFTLTGVVIGLPREGPSGLRFRFEIESARQGDRPVRLPRQVQLAAWRPDPGASLGALEGLRAGERWQLAARLRAPHGSANPHGFDVELWFFEQGIRATGSVRPASARRLATAAGQPLERARQAVRNRIDAQVRDPGAAGVIAALAIGDQAAIEREDWALFRDAGIAHLMAISGLHVTMFAWLAGAAIGAAWRRAGELPLRLPAPTAARWGGLVAAAAYAAFSGWGVPSQRTVWMLATACLLPSLGRRWPWPPVMLAAAVVVAAADPWALLQPGFWLSFAAVGLLLASAPQHAEEDGARHAARSEPEPGAEPGAGPGAGPGAAAGTRAAEERSSRVAGLAGLAGRLAAAARGGVRSQLIATVGLAPLTLVFFQQLALAGLVANLIAIPLVTLAITPLALLGTVAYPLWTAAAWLIDGLRLLLGGLTAWPGAVWFVPAAPAWAAAAGLVAGALAILPLPWRWRLLAVPLALPLLLPPREHLPEGVFELLAADVGQGTAALLRTRRHLLVYDTGPPYGPDNDAGQRVLVPLLRARGDHRVDLLVLSHRDSDHVGGAAALVAVLPTAALASSLEASHPLHRLVPASRPCAAGERWQWDGVEFAFLHPDANDVARGHTRSNALSCVLRVRDAAGRGVLLTGDIERPEEAELLAAGSDLRADGLLVPHHGSRTSSSAAFLAAVAPRWAVAQSGYRNRHGHPAADVVERYRAAGIELRTSPDCGAWQWRSDDPLGQGICRRDAYRRYWHHAVPRAAEGASAGR